ncbi:MAG: ROK family protein [Pseudomonadota bacterium]
MIAVAIVTRKLRRGKTYEDFRKAWFHTEGFGTPANLHTMINVDDPRKITVIGFIETSESDLERLLEIDIAQRLDNTLDDIIEPDQIERQFGLMRAQDDFSAAGALDYAAARVAGRPVDQAAFDQRLERVRQALVTASEKRDRLRAARGE